MELKRRASGSGEKPAPAPKRRKCDHTKQHAIALAPTEGNSSDKQGILLEEGLLSLEETPKDLLIMWAHRLPGIPALCKILTLVQRPEKLKVFASSSPSSRTEEPDLGSRPRGPRNMLGRQNGPQSPWKALRRLSHGTGKI
jgi:hypothetical protein